MDSRPRIPRRPLKYGLGSFCLTLPEASKALSDPSSEQGTVPLSLSVTLHVA